jgi:hypothetical protein
MDWVHGIREMKCVGQWAKWRVGQEEERGGESASWGQTVA